MLDSILNPRRVAIIGASDNPARIGGRPIAMMQAGGFEGEIFPVNPNRETIQGLPAFSSIGDVPGTVDCAVVAVPVNIAVKTIAQCADAGVRSLIVFTSGFAEMGAEGEAAQAEVARIGASTGMRVLGPNCLGAFNLKTHWYATFANIAGITRLPPGPTGIVTQSGAYGAHVYTAAQLRGLGATYWVTTGNEVDVDVAEVIAHFATDDAVEVIVAYAEGMRDPERIANALSLAREARKPVIFMKVGTTDAGARAAASHTASLAGSDAVYEALFRQYGVYRARTTEELVDIAYACQFGGFPKGRRVALHTISGGVGVQMADDAIGHKLTVPPLREDAQRAIKKLVPFAGTGNPVDFTGQAVNQPEVAEQAVDIIVGTGDYDAHVVYLAGITSSPATREPCREMFERLRNRHSNEIMLLSMFENAEVTPAYERMGFPFFADPSLAIRALRGLVHFAESFDRPPAAPAPARPRGALNVPEHRTAEHEALAILASAGIPCATNQLAPDAATAVRLANEIGGKVVMKIASPDIAHKSDFGGVLMGIDGDNDVAKGFDTLIQRAAQAHPKAIIEGVIVAEMVPPGVETVLGVVTDPVFGPAVMFGLGGVLIEVLGDVTFRLAPFGKDEALRMIDEIAGRAVLDGVRGAPPCDIDALADALSRLSVFAANNADRLDSIDINPFILHESGGVAVDALIVPRAADTP